MARQYRRRFNGVDFHAQMTAGKREKRRKQQDGQKALTPCGVCAVCKARADYGLEPDGGRCEEYRDRLGGEEADECWFGEDCGACDACNTIPLYAGLT